MPGYLLQVGATLVCAHGGQAQPVATNPRVKVMGQPVVAQPIAYAITGCPNPPPPTGTGPCLTAQWVRGALRVRSMGQPLLLQDGQALCTPTGTPLTVVLTQTRVKGM
jgi:hypothetical protein